MQTMTWNDTILDGPPEVKEPIILALTDGKRAFYHIASYHLNTIDRFDNQLGPGYIIDDRYFMAPKEDGPLFLWSSIIPPIYVKEEPQNE